MDKVEVGKVYKIKDVSVCGAAMGCGATHVEITEQREDRNGMCYDLLKDGVMINYCWNCFKPEDLELEEKRLEYGYCEEGDIIENNVGQRAKLLGVYKLYFVRSCFVNFDTADKYGYTYEEAKEKGWKLVTEEEPKERTTEDVMVEIFKILEEALK